MSTPRNWDETSFIDIAVQDGVREAMLSGQAALIFDRNSGALRWANGAAAALFGLAAIGSRASGEHLPASVEIGFRQIRAVLTSLKEAPRTALVRLSGGMTSRLVRCHVRQIALSGVGGTHALVTAPVRDTDMSQAECLAVALTGLEDEEAGAAIVDGAGRVLHAGRRFAALDLPERGLRALASQTRSEADRLVKQIVDGRDPDTAFAAGVGRLGDLPERYLVVAVALARRPELDPEDRPSAQTTALASAAVPDPGKGTAADTNAEPAAGAASAPAATAEQADGGSEPAGTDRRGPQPDDGTLARRADEAPFDGPDLSSGPIRFVWRTDAAGVFTDVSTEFGRAVGPRAADLKGRSFTDIIAAMALDPRGDLTAAFARRDTWSGKSVQWPIEGTDLQVPVDLAALPYHNRDRQFEGYRGFGVVRMADAGTDPDARGLALVRESGSDDAPETTGPASAIDPEPGAPGAGPAAGADDAFRATAPATQQRDLSDEPPVLAAAPAHPMRRADDVVVPFDTDLEDGPIAPRHLSAQEAEAFRKIGQALGRQELPASALAEGRDEEASASPDPEDTQTTDDGPAPAEEVPRPSASGPVSAADSSPRQAQHADDEATMPSPAGEPWVDEATDDGAVSFVETDWGDDLEAFVDQLNGTADVSDGGARGQDDAAATTQEPEIGETTGQDTKPAAEEQYASGDTVSDHDQDRPGAPDGLSAKRQDDEAEKAPPSDAFPTDVAQAPEPDEPVGGADPGLGPKSLDELPLPLLIVRRQEAVYANAAFARMTGDADTETLNARGLDSLFGGATPAADADPADRPVTLVGSDGRTFAARAHLQIVPWMGARALMFAFEPRADIGVPTDLAEAGELADTPGAAIADAHMVSSAEIAELRAILDTATDGVILIDADSTIRSLSASASALFGYANEEVEGKSFSFLFAHESQRAALDYLHGLSNNGVASVLNEGREVLGRERNGGFLPLFMTIGRMPATNGYCAVIRDITPWKQTEQALQDAKRQAEQASNTKSEFLAKISHEIRTPLNAIIGFSELMAEERFGPIGNERYKDYLADINRSGRHVLDLVNDLLDISKIEAGKQELEFESVALNDAIGEAIAMVQPQANRNQIIVRSSLESTVPPVVADLRSIKQIVLNLLSNAVRFTHAGGQVIVSTSYTADGAVLLRIRDTGIGMSEKELESALKPFQQVTAVGRQRGDGTGLGLPLTKALVEANRAEFAISSEPGQGTRIDIVFPPARVLAS